jgi:hypothetical protein
MSQATKKPRVKKQDTSAAEAKEDVHKMIQFYDLVKKDKAMEKLYDYPNKAQINLKLPGRYLICGPTGSGKSSTALQIIKSIGVFELIIIITKMTDEPLYQYLKTQAEKSAEKFDVPLESLFILSNNLNDLPSKDEFDKLQNSLIIIDDHVNTKASELKGVLDLWIMGRKLSISMMWITQSFYLTDKVIRNNSQYIILKKLADLKNLKLILSLYKLDTPIEKIIKMCKESTPSNDTTQFFMIDVLTDNPNLRFRHNFKGIGDSETEEKN